MTSTTAVSVGHQKKTLDSLTLRYLVVVGLILIASVGFSIANDNFYSLTNVGILLRSIAVLFLLSMGMTFIMLTGGIDLSVGSNVAFSGGVGVITLTSTGSAFLGFGAAIIAGMLIGAVNGFFIGRLKLSAFMVTLATFALARGLVLVIYDATSINVTNATFLWLGGNSWGNMPVVVPIIALVFAALSVLLYKTSFGRDVYAAGSNFAAAFVLGRRPERTLVWIYVLSGALAGLSASSLWTGCFLANPGQVSTSNLMPSQR